MKMKSLLFVYNADSGLFNLVTDIAHKIFSPQTYACQLCSITHGNLTMREEWRAFIDELPLECEFMHRDEFLKAHSSVQDELPAVYTRSNGELRLCVDASKIISCSDLSELKRLIQSHCAGNRKR